MRRQHPHLARDRSSCSRCCSGVLYPLAVYAIGQVAFKDKADGSLVKVERAGRRLEADRAGLHERAVLPPPPVEGRHRLRRQRLRRGRERGLEPGAVEPEADRQRARREHRRHDEPVRDADRPDVRPGAGHRQGRQRRHRQGRQRGVREEQGRHLRLRPGHGSANVCSRTAQENGLGRRTCKVPVDAVTASFSGSTPTSASRTRGSRRRASPRARHMTVDDGARTRVEAHRRPRARVHGRAGRQRARAQPRARSRSRSVSTSSSSDVGVRARSECPCPAR